VDWKVIIALLLAATLLFAVLAGTKRNKKP
jgi:hypothetical protein